MIGLKGALPRYSALAILFVFLCSCSTVQPTTKPPNGGPAIEQPRKENYAGPKARLTVSRFVDQNAGLESTGQVGPAMARMVANSLSATNRYIIVERQSSEAVKIGEAEGDELLVEGAVTEFDPGPMSAGGGKSGNTPPLGGIFGGGKNSRITMLVTVTDVRTGRRIASEQVEGKASDAGEPAGSSLPSALSPYSKTPMEKAIRIAVEEAVKLIVAKTPLEYYRLSSKPLAKTVGPSPKKAPEASKAPSATPAPSPVVLPSQSPSPPLRVTRIEWPTVNLREGPGMNFKVVGNAKKGTSIAILEEKAGWFFVRLEGGSEAWVSKTATSEAPKTPPPAVPSPPKPKPM